ncbi:chromate efflux transporter [Pedobacter sp. HDW13]|nr:chromate efflux transporter [Pedobacter sp. HDW13]QIL38844.1 chromate efflux transporter [Pedobacter sp. HDW13]
MALVSLIQRIMVEQDKTIDNEQVLDSITVASFMPGPLAVNVVANIGYTLKGKLGAVVSIFAVLLPACILILCLAYVYFSSGFKIEWTAVMKYVGATIGIIIFSTGLQLFRKEIALNYSKIALFIFAVALDLIIGSYVLTLVLMLVGATVGLFIDKEKNNYREIAGNLKMKYKLRLSTVSLSVLIVLLINQILFVSGFFKGYSSIFFKIGTVFSGISISLFGGGYVIIPIMQSLFVKDLNWLTDKQFIDAIAFSQVTPGPILVSSTFIGYKLAGFSGALLATCCMFLPAAALMIMVSKIFNRTKDHPLIKSMISGIKVVVIGLIISSAFKILLMQPRTILVGVICIIAFVLSTKYKLSPVYLILGSILFGILSTFIS